MAGVSMSRPFDYVAEELAAAAAIVRKIFLDDLEDASIAFERFFEEGEGRVLKLLKDTGREVVLFQRPGVGVVLSHVGIEIRGFKQYLRMFDVEFGPNESITKIAILAAVNQYGGKFSNYDPRMFIEVLRRKIDKYAE